MYNQGYNQQAPYGAYQYSYPQQPPYKGAGYQQSPSPPQPQGSPYGAPPLLGPGNYNPQPPNPYGSTPSTYPSSPSPNLYGSGPPQGQYSSYPTPSSYGGYQGGPPPPLPGVGVGGPRFLGVVIPPPPPAPPISNLPGYNAHFDADRIRKATKGFGTDENTLIQVMSPLDAFQMDLLARTYEQITGRTLKKTLESELSHWLEYTLVLLSMGPLGGDVHLLHRACAGAGTHEDLLNEILLGRSNEEIFLLKQAYQRTYNKDLVHVVQGELSMKTKRLFNMALAGARDESNYVDHALVQSDVETLYRAGPGKIGTDEIAICGILLSRSNAHLAAIAQAFPQRHRHSLSYMIHSEFSGHMRDALMFIVRGAEADGHGVHRDAQMLEEAMRGIGTKDERLIYRIVRAHWDRPRFNAIKNQYQVSHNKTLRRRVESETSGKYEKALVAIIDMN